MSDWVLVYLVSLVFFFGVLGCSDVGSDPSLTRVCRVPCERAVQCGASTTVAQCVSDCVTEAGPIVCDRDDAALEACRMQMATWSCDALASDELPPWCQNVCRTQRSCGEEICAEFACTEQGIRNAVAFGYGPNTFRCSGPTTVTSNSEIVIGNDVILDGEGNLRISGGSTHRVLSVASSTAVELRGLAVVDGSSDDGGGIKNDGALTIADSTISNNRASGNGGGIASLQGELTLRGCELRGNSAQSGGAIFSEAPLMMADSIVSGNAALAGGGVRGIAGFAVTGSLISNNTAEQRGGGIDSEDSRGTISNSEISGNTAGMAGGGLHSPGGLTMTNTTVSGNAVEDGCGGGMFLGPWAKVTNSTVSANSALGESGCGGGIFAEETGPVLSQWLTLAHVTIADNHATSRGGAISVVRSPIGPFWPLELENSIVHGDCGEIPFGPGWSGGYNVESPGETCGLDLSTSQVGVSPQDLALGPLQDNGGPTATRALGQGSVAVDMIPSSACSVDEDQRGVARPTGNGCDAGAFELDP